MIFLNEHISPNFSPSSINLNYIGDAGLSGSPQGFAVSTPASTPVTLVVSDSSVSGTAAGTSYTLQIPSCALINPANINHPPVAVVKTSPFFRKLRVDWRTQVLMAVRSIQMAGSITISQNPPGPYSQGNTSVVLTVVDSQGATAQATGVVTVKNPGPDLEITKNHTGNFAQGQTGAIYTINVTNQGSAQTTGTVTVTDILPAALTATSISGTGWTCTLSSLTCTRSDALANGSPVPPITVVVDVSSTAPATVVNQAEVLSGNPPNVNALNIDMNIDAVLPNLASQKSHIGNFALGQPGAAYSIQYRIPDKVRQTHLSPSLTHARRPDRHRHFRRRMDLHPWESHLHSRRYIAIRRHLSGHHGHCKCYRHCSFNRHEHSDCFGRRRNLLSDDLANDPTTIVGIVPELTITSTHTGNFTAGQTGQPSPLRLRMAASRRRLGLSR